MYLYNISSSLRLNFIYIERCRDKPHIVEYAISLSNYIKAHPECKMYFWMKDSPIGQGAKLISASCKEKKFQNASWADIKKEYPTKSRQARKFFDALKGFKLRDMVHNPQEWKQYFDNEKKLQGTK